MFLSHRKQKTGLKWVIQLITQFWRLIYIQWLHHSEIKHAGEVLANHAKEIIIDDDITY